MELTLRDAAEQGAADAKEHGRLRRFVQMREIGIFLAALGIFIFLSIARSDTFFTQRNVFRVAQAISLLTIIAVGMTFLFIVGELDLSVGAMYGLLALFISNAMFVWDLHPMVAMPLVVVTGA